jgi:hypothetical protein
MDELLVLDGLAQYDFSTAIIQARKRTQPSRPVRVVETPMRVGAGQTL